MSKYEGRDLLAALEKEKLLEYGTSFPAIVVQNILGIKVPRTGSKSTFDQLALQEMAAVDYVRNVLLGRGKYLSGAGGTYKILTVSENRKQIENYMSSAQRKLLRGIKLSKTTPKEPGSPPDHQEIRAELKLKDIRTRLKDK